MNDQILSEAITAGMLVMSSEDIRIPTKDIETLANFKGILRGILSGELVLASPDRIMPDIEGISEKDSDKD